MYEKELNIQKTKSFRNPFTINRSKVYRFLNAIIFSAIVSLTFLGIHMLMPQKEKLRNEIATVLFILVSVLVLFPLRDMILLRLSKRGHLNYYLPHKHQVFDFIEKPFSITSLVYKDFPDLAEWLSISEYSLAILESSRKTFFFYQYKKNKVVGKNIIDKKNIDKLCLQLTKHSQEGLHISEPSLSEDVTTQMKEINAQMIYPLLFRKNIVGLLIFNQSSKNILGKSLIEVFRHKATLTIQNYILSQRIIDFRVYENEFKAAQRVLKGMENLQIPNISNYSIEKKPLTQPYLLEYFELSHQVYLFQIIICSRLSASVGLIIYGLIGQLYAYIHLNQKTNLDKITSYLSLSKDWQLADPLVEILFLELNTQKNSVNIFSNQSNYILLNKLKKKNSEVEKQTDIDAYKMLEIDLNSTSENGVNSLCFYYQKNLIFSITKNDLQVL